MFDLFSVETADKRIIRRQGVLIDEDTNTTCKAALTHLRIVTQLAPRWAEGHHSLGAALLNAALRNDITAVPENWGELQEAEDGEEGEQRDPAEYRELKPPPGVGVRAVARRELLTEALVHYRIASELQESSDCVRRRATALWKTTFSCVELAIVVVGGRWRRRRRGAQRWQQALRQQ